MVQPLAQQQRQQRLQRLQGREVTRLRSSASERPNEPKQRKADRETRFLVFSPTLLDPAWVSLFSLSWSVNNNLPSSGDEVDGVYIRHFQCGQRRAARLDSTPTQDAWSLNTSQLLTGRWQRPQSPSNQLASKCIYYMCASAFACEREDGLMRQKVKKGWRINSRRQLQETNESSEKISAKSDIWKLLTGNFNKPQLI